MRVLMHVLHNAADPCIVPRSVCSCSPHFVVKHSCAVCAQYLGGVPVPAQVLREAVEADVVGLTLRPRGAESQAVIVLLHLLHLRSNTPTALKVKLHPISRWTDTVPGREIKGATDARDRLQCSDDNAP